MALKAVCKGGKRFSHQRSNLPSDDLAVSVGGLTDQRAKEPETHQMVALGMGYSHGSGSQNPRGFGSRVQSWGRWVGDFEQDVGCRGQRPPKHNQRSARRHVHGSREFQEILSIIATSTHEDRYGQRQTRPAATFDSLLCSLQECSSTSSLPEDSRTLGAKQRIGPKISVRNRKRPCSSRSKSI